MIYTYIIILWPFVVTCVDNGFERTVLELSNIATLSELSHVNDKQPH